MGPGKCEITHSQPKRRVTLSNRNVEGHSIDCCIMACFDSNPHILIDYLMLFFFSTRKILVFSISLEIIDDLYLHIHFWSSLFLWTFLSSVSQDILDFSVSINIFYSFMFLYTLVIFFVSLDAFGLPCFYRCFWSSLFLQTVFDPLRFSRQLWSLFRQASFVSVFLDSFIFICFSASAFRLLCFSRHFWSFCFPRQFFKMFYFSRYFYLLCFSKQF